MVFLVAHFIAMGIAVDAFLSASVIECLIVLVPYLLWLLLWVYCCGWQRGHEFSKSPWCRKLVLVLAYAAENFKLTGTV